MSQLEDRQRVNSSLVNPFFFNSGPQKTVCGLPTLGGEKSASLIQMSISSRNVLTDIPRIMFNQKSGLPVA